MGITVPATLPARRPGGKDGDPRPRTGVGSLSSLAPLPEAQLHNPGEREGVLLGQRAHAGPPPRPCRLDVAVLLELREPLGGAVARGGAPPAEAPGHFLRRPWGLSHLE